MGKMGKIRGPRAPRGESFKRAGVAVRLSSVVLIGALGKSSFGGMMVSLTASLYTVEQRMTWKQHGSWRTGASLVLRAA